MAKDKSFHSAAIIVDATVDIADIVVSPGGDFGRQQRGFTS